MNIPVRIRKGDSHPSFNDNVYKGADFCLHAQLYNKIQEIINDSNNGFSDRIQVLQSQLVEFEKEIISPTKSSISKDDQITGKLIQRTQKDAAMINTLSRQLFTLLNDICQAEELTSIIPIIPFYSIKMKKADVASAKIMPGISSVAISSYLDDTLKRAKNICQRTKLLLKSINNLRVRNKQNSKASKDKHNWANAVTQNIRKLLNQRPPFEESISKAINICAQVKDERINHLTAIEKPRNKKTYNNDVKFIDTVIINQGKDEYESRNSWK